MSDAAAILPSLNGPFERALFKAALAHRVPVPFREIMDPATTPARFMPVRAGHESADLWYDDWPEERRREMIARAAELAALVGTRAAIPAFLPFVDAELVDRVSHPRRFVLGFSALGVDPIGHKPFTSHLLVKVPLKAPRGAFVVGVTPLGFGALLPVDQEPVRRVRRAVQVAKAPETFITINHGHRQPITFSDGFPLDGSYRFGDFRDRKRL